MLIALHKPYGVLSQFTPETGSQWRTLADFKIPKDLYPIGRLDADSEGLLLLTNEAQLVARLLEPSMAHEREYWVQVERIPSDEALKKLQTGVILGDYRTLPCKAQRMESPLELPARMPPIRVRLSVPDCWLSLQLIEGKNRQVRRMTAAVGHPTLRLLRARIGQLKLSELKLQPGEWLELNLEQRNSALRN